MSSLHVESLHVVVAGAMAVRINSGVLYHAFPAYLVLPTTGSSLIRSLSMHNPRRTSFNPII